MKQQTAVEWLVEQFQKTFSEYIKLNPDWEVIEQAKEMEKQQIKNAYQEGDGDEYYLEENKIWSEQYYNETYNQ